MDRLRATNGAPPTENRRLSGHGGARRCSIRHPITERTEKMKILVINVNTSATMTETIGRSYSVVTTLQRSVPAIEDRLKLAGLIDRCASVRASGMSTLEVDRDPKGAIAGIVAEARKAVELEHAEVICLGCAGMAGLEEAITSDLHIPIIDGVGAAVRLAEALVGLGLSTSKISTYAKPDPKRMIAWPLSKALGLQDHS